MREFRVLLQHLNRKLKRNMIGAANFSSFCFFMHECSSIPASVLVNPHTKTHKPRTSRTVPWPRACLVI